jgi:Zn-dependent membrane protease YugP
MLNLCGIVVVILKMATSRNLLMSGIISGHQNLPTYEMLLFLPVAIFKMAATIPQEFNIV